MGKLVHRGAVIIHGIVFANNLFGSKADLENHIMTYAPLTFAFSDGFTITENGAKAPTDVVQPPAISATNEASETWRIGRIFAVWGSASATVSLLSHRYQQQWDGAVVALNDHKGTLEISWRDRQSRELFEGVVMGAWERAGDHCGAHALG